MATMGFFLHEFLKVDIILYSEDPLEYVARALSPGKVNTVSFIDEKRI